jgi:hypothetical protein
LAELQQKAKTTISKLERNAFLPRGGGKCIGRDPSRLWTLLPQPSLRRRHMLVDTTALIQFYQQQDVKVAKDYAAMKGEETKGIWDEVFHLRRAKGVKFPGLDTRYVPHSVVVTLTESLHILFISGFHKGQ